MSRQSGGGDNPAKGIAIIVVGVVVGLLVFNSFPEGGTQVAATAPGADQPRETTTTTKGGPAGSTTSSSIPLKENKDVKVLVANGTTTSGATAKVIAALKPACYAVQTPVDANAKIKGENRATTMVYPKPGFEREAALIAKNLQLPDNANAALPAELPIPSKGQPDFNVLIVLAKDLVDKPPQPLPGAQCGATSTTAAGGARTTTTARRAGTTTTAARITTTTRAITTTSRAPTTTAP